MSREYRLTLHYERPPLSENDRLHRYERASRVRALRDASGFWGRSLRLRTERVEVTLIWVVRDRRKRDEDNVVPTLKALCDGLVDAGIVPDDTPRYMAKNMPRIEYREGAKPHLELVVSVGEPNLD